MDPMAYTMIAGLAATLATVVGAAFRFLLAENKELKEQLAKQNEAMRTTNDANARLAAMVPELIGQLRNGAAPP